MAMTLGALYQALVAGHVDEELARKAAEEVAAYESRLAGIEADVKLLKWMVGTNLVLTVAILGKVVL
jgi:hypothetical protein